MLKYGVGIKNIEASTLYEYNKGLRTRYESKEAIMPNSLFLDFLLENKLKLHKEETTREIICLEFNYGTRSFEEEIDHLNKIINRITADITLKEEEKNAKIDRINELLSYTEERKDDFEKLSIDELREKLYENGISIRYVNKNKQGKITKDETIHYRMLFRSTGKAKKGSVIFICERLYKKAIRYLLMDKLDLLKKNPMIVEASAYMPLVASSIVGKIHIDPDQILILEDIDSFFTTKVIEVATNENKQCFARKIDSYRLKNTMFDGQGLIDSSIFPSWGDGYVLLRQHFCKFACFCSHIQKFFRDYFGDKYETATVTDMFGIERRVKDIKVITTNNSVKWLKFDITYEEWCKAVRANGSYFGVVKTAHKSKLGNVQKMSYQMINALNIDDMKEISQESVNYVNKLKTDKEFFLDYLKSNANFCNDYEALVDLCAWNKDFHRTDYFKDRKHRIIENHIFKLKTGKLIQEAENLVIVGSPFAMLLYGATGDKTIIDKDTTFSQEKGAIQCYTGRFKDDEYLAFFRSPFNSRNNLSYVHNVYSEEMTKYFELGELVIAVNMRNTDWQDRNNGADQDSDSGYTTNQPHIVRHAKYCYENYPTIVNNIPKEKTVYTNEMKDYARMDSTLAKSSLAIGLSSNLAQIAQTYMYNFKDEKYSDYVCILSVLAQVAIDNAKRKFDIDLNNEIDRIKNDLNIQENGYPEFWNTIKIDFSGKNVNPDLRCPMNELCKLEFVTTKRTPTIPLSEIFIKHKLDVSRRSSIKVEEFIEHYCLGVLTYNTSRETIFDKDDDYLVLVRDFDKMIDNLNKINVSKSYISLFSFLIDRCFILTNRMKGRKDLLKLITSKNKSALMSTLYNLNRNALRGCFIENR